jgi:excisionase family DNA binding protein
MPRSVARLSSDDIPSDAAAHLAEELPATKTLALGEETIALTQQAANLLDVSRPTLVKLLESGLIPYEQPGVHRRVSRAALDEFLASRSERRRTGLEALAETFDPDVPDEYVRTR